MNGSFRAMCYMEREGKKIKRKEIRRYEKGTSVRWWDKVGKWGETSPHLDQFGGMKKKRKRGKAKKKKRGRKSDIGEKGKRGKKEKERIFPVF